MSDARLGGWASAAVAMVRERRSGSSSSATGRRSPSTGWCGGRAFPCQETPAAAAGNPSAAIRSPLAGRLGMRIPTRRTRAARAQGILGQWSLRRRFIRRRLTAHSGGDVDPARSRPCRRTSCRPDAAGLPAPRSAMASDPRHRPAVDATTSGRMLGDQPGRAASRFRAVTLPALKPTMFLVLTLGLIGTWQVFDQVYIMSQGAPAKTTLTPAYLSYQTSFQSGKWGQGEVRARRSPSFCSRSSSCSACSSRS